MKKVFIIFIFFSCLFASVSAQNNKYFVEGKQLFDSCKYQDAIIKLKAAHLKEPDNERISFLIECSNNCINYRKSGDSLFLQKKYSEALNFYEKITELNNNSDTIYYKIKDIVNKLRCFPENKELGLAYFDNALYNLSLKTYFVAKQCEIKDNSKELDSLINVTEICIDSKTFADSLLFEKDYAKAILYYKKVLFYNPNDIKCKNLITRINKLLFGQNNYREVLQFGYTYQNLCPYGFSMAYVKKWGYFTNIRLDFNNELQYSAIAGVSKNIYKSVDINIHISLGCGYGKYADFWYEKGEKARKTKYPNGLQFESSFCFMFDKWSFVLGGIVPTFNYKFTTYTIGFNRNINLKSKKQ